MSDAALLLMGFMALLGAAGVGVVAYLLGLKDGLTARDPMDDEEPWEDDDEQD